MKTAVFFLCALLLVLPGHARRRQKPAPPKNPIDSIGIQADFDPDRFGGKWFLAAVASPCSYLSENHYRLEATNVVVATVAESKTPEKSLLFSTFRPLDGHCWNIKQTYFATKTPGRFQVRGRGNPVDVVIGETDYHSYAILYYQKARKLSAKLYGRAVKVSNAVAEKFEQRVSTVGLDSNLVFYFPTYGFCDSVDEFHILDETKYTGTR